MSTDESGADDILKGGLLLERDFPEDYRAMRAILSEVAPSVIAEGNDQLWSELVEIVYGYGRERPRSEYRNEATLIEDKIKGLIDNLDSVVRMVEKLDPHYSRRMVDFMSQMPLEADVNYNLGDVLRDFEKAQVVASYFRLAIHVATYFEARPSGRSRPPLPQFVPAVQLMDLWERLTEKKVVTPKGTAPGKSKPEALQPSTEFVRLGLKMIDAKITVANTVTLIKRALAERKESSLQRFVDLIDMPEWQDVEEALNDGENSQMVK